MKRVAFTLIELLVVVAIIGLLVGIVFPSLASARTQARRITCASHLHQVGIAMVAYMHDSGDRMPYVSYMPSIGPAPLTDDKTIYLADVLSRQISKQINVLQCPDDRPGKTDRPVPNTGLSYFQSERSSYEYRTRLAGLTPIEFTAHAGGGGPSGSHVKVAPNTVWFARDFENFHGKAGQIGARRYVYIDGNVRDYEN